MKKRMWAVWAAAGLLGVAACGKKEEPSDAVSAPAEAVSEQAGGESAAEAPDNGSAGGSTAGTTDDGSGEGDGSAAESAASVAAETPKTAETGGDDTGVYPGSTGTAEVSMGIREAVCTVKLPLNYIIDGGYYDEENISRGLDGLGRATTTVADGVAAGSFSGGHPMAFYVVTSLDADPTVINATMYDAATQGTIEDMKGYYPDGKVIGGDAVQGWLYHKENTGNDTDFAVAMQVSGDVLLEFTYEGPLDDEVGEDEAARRLYDLVTVK